MTPLQLDCNHKNELIFSYTRPKQRGNAQN